MRTFIILIILAALGFAAWTWWSGRNKPAPLLNTAASVMPPGPQNPPPPQPTPLPAEVKSDYDQAELLWKQAVDAGQVPAQSAKAALMGKLFGKVLIGVYNKPGLRGLELTLIEQRLTPIGNELFFSKTRFPTDETGLIAMHQVQSGESPDRIAKKYGMSMEFLNRLRGRDANDSKLNVGDMVKVVKVKEQGGAFLHIDKGDFTIDCFIGGVFARRYPISHGAQQSPTPTGKTRLVDRVLNPPWTDPKTHEVYGPDDVRNILGKVWMAFSPEGIGQSGLGIHGYSGPNPQMRALVSNGCIRLENDSALELYRTISPMDRCKTEVAIVD